MAITGGSERVVRNILLHKDLNVNARNLTGHTPLQRALQMHRYNIAQLLVRRGANVNAPLANGGHLLRRAVSAGNIRMVRFLIDSGADVNRNNPLSRAVAIGHPDIVRLLIKSGARVNRNTINAAKNNQMRNLVINTMGHTSVAKKVIRRAETALRNRRANSILRHTLGRTNLPGTALNIIARSMTARHKPSSASRNQNR
jgi:ankyrin repeat protein